MSDTPVTGVPVPDVAPNLIERTFALNDAYDVAGNTPRPGTGFNARRVCFYTGMQCEELGEKIKAISKGEVEPRAIAHLQAFAEMLDKFGKEFKAGMHEGAVLRSDREELIDGDFDMLVVTTGSMSYQSRNFRGAIAHGLDRNDAKIEGGARVDANGKWLKPADWIKPDMSPFVEKADE